MSLTMTPVATETKSIGLREAWGEGLVALGNLYSNLVVLDGDLANSTKADLFAAAHPDRFFEMGIAEQNMLGVAAGLATTGYVPWISTFAAFVAKRALDQIRVVIAQPSLNVKMCGAYSGILTSKTGKTHQSVEDLAVFRAMPHVVTIAPADAVELQAAMAAMMEDDRPTYLRVTRDATPVIFADDYTFEFGKARLLRKGTDVGIVSTGVQTVRALEAADLLGIEGVSVAVLHVPTLKPLDVDAICEIAAMTGAIVTAEDHSIIGGLGSAVAEVLSEHIPTRMRRIGWQDTYGESGPNDALLEKYGLTARHVANAGLEVLALTSPAGAWSE
ncbi:MAG: transketolase family protein [Chloroflexota bacterium]|nr:transketolase family protein [Chloroflexota bacterium]